MYDEMDSGRICFRRKGVILTMDEASNKRAALLVVTLGTFLTPLGGSAMNVALPAIGKELGMSAILLSWVMTAYLLASTVFLIPFGRVADMYGRKRVFTCGMSIFAIASFFLIFCKSSVLFISLRILQGIGGAMTFSIGMAILTSVFPVQERGKVIGINTAAVYSGLSLGPLVGGFLTQHLGWRSIFGVNVLLALTCVFLILWRLKGEWIEAEGERFDLSGSIIHSLTLIAMIYGLSILPSVSGALLFAAGVLGVLVLFKVEMSVENPVVNVRLFQNNRVFVLSNVAALVHYSGTIAVGFLLSLYLQFIKGVGPRDAGLILIAQPVVQAALSPLTGRLSDRIEPRIMASLGMISTATGLFLLSFLGETTTLAFIIASLIFLGFGYALFSPPNTNAVMSSVERRSFGVAAGILGTMRQVGGMFSMGITMVIFSLFIGKVQITPPYYPVFLKSMKVAFAFFTVLCFGGVFASLARGRVR
jgi:EmrB/QacA subfamily drug resistance transporter